MKAIALVFLVLGSLMLGGCRDREDRTAAQGPTDPFHRNGGDVIQGG